MYLPIQYIHTAHADLPHVLLDNATPSHRPAQTRKRNAFMHP